MSYPNIPCYLEEVTELLFFKMHNLALSASIEWPEFCTIFVHGHNRRVNSGLSIALCQSELDSLKTPPLKSLYGGKITLSTQLMKPNFHFLSPTDEAPLTVSLTTNPSSFNSEI